MVGCYAFQLNRRYAHDVSHRTGTQNVKLLNSIIIMQVKNIVYVCVGIAAVVVAYQALVVVPQNRIDAEQRKEMVRIQVEKEREEQKRIDLWECQNSAYQAYSGNWDAACKLIGEKPDCTLPAYKANGYQELLDAANDRCVTLYK